MMVIPARTPAVTTTSTGLTGTGPSFPPLLGGAPGSLNTSDPDLAELAAHNQRVLQQARARGVPTFGGLPSDGATARYAQGLEEMGAQMRQMLDLQLAMQRENLLFTSISNVLKTKHDTLKNIVSNIR